MNKIGSAVWAVLVVASAALPGAAWAAAVDIGPSSADTRVLGESLRSDGIDIAAVTRLAAAPPVVARADESRSSAAEQTSAADVYAVTTAAGRGVEAEDRLGSGETEIENEGGGTAAVPLPAAIWLFGGGLAYLVGRRRAVS